jgi:hypothetical protein
MFGTVDTQFTNYRNKFSKKYYDSIIKHNESDDFLVTEVKSHGTKTHSTADVILCYRNKTRKEYNSKALAKLGLEPYDIGCKMICVTNEFGELGLWNHTELTITNIEDDLYTLSTNNGINYEFSEKKIKNENKFRFAYCVNVYEAQGKTFNSYYWCSEDDFFLKRIDYARTRNRIAYTIISRIKE